MRTALIAGEGRLAAEVAAALAPAVIAAPAGHPPEGLEAEPFRLERLVPFLDSLVDRGVGRVVFAGAARRPALDPEAFDPRTAQLAPLLAGAMAQGDDGALRALLSLFEDWGLAVAAIPEVAPALCPAAGVLVGRVTAAQEADVARAADVVAGLGALDIGQGAVVSRGLTLAVETLPGTEAMLDFAGRHGARGAVLWKAPKPGQDRRIDLPTVGPDTVAQAVAAGLAGIAWEAGGVLLVGRAAAVAAAEAAGLFLWSRG